MQNLFIDILEMTLPVSALIALLMLCSPLLKKSYVAKWRYYMWLFVALRLIFPVKLSAKTPITMSIPNTIAAPAQAEAGIDVMRLVTAVWLFGIAIITVYQIICYIRFGRRMRRCSAQVSDTRILDAFEAAKAKTGVRRRLDIRMCSQASSPMIFGIVKPVLYLPYIDFADNELPIVLRHELVHFKRNDILYKLLLLAVRTAHWFNPTVYIMFRAANRDMELACDAEVVRSENAEFRYSYCDAIMRLVHNGCKTKHTHMSTCFALSKKTIKERLGTICDFKIKRRGILMFCVVAVSVAVSGSIISFATEQVADKVEDDLQIIARPTEQPQKTDEPTDDTVNTPGRDAVISYASDNDSSASAYSAAEDVTGASADTSEQDMGAVGEIAIGTERASVNDTLGEPSAVSLGGSKEVYALSDGTTAVAQYDGEILEAGYILVD